MTTNLNNPIVIYIGGYGRSGSTLLDIILSNNTDIAGFGEINQFLYDYKSLCSCGKTFDQCTYWANFYTTLEKHAPYKEQYRKYESLLGIFGTTKSIRNRYDEFYSDMFSYISQKSKTIKYLIDSSKTSYDAILRPLRLKTISPQVLLIHLKRSPAKVRRSLEKGSNRTMEGKGERKIIPFVSITHLYITNILTWLIGKLFFKKQYVIINYEELVSQPEQSLQKIEALLNIHLIEIKQKIADGEDLMVGHMTGGNRMRFERKIKLIKQ